MSRYYPAVEHYRELYGERLQKLVLDAGFSCPNRDGHISTGGCTFCDNAAFHPSYSTSGKSLHQQIDEGIEFHKVRYRNAEKYLAYFQAFSNTYAPLEKLKRLYEDALSHQAIVGLTIGTRPDCVDEEKLSYIASLQSQGAVIQMEYGIESCYDETLLHINRGHDFAVARRAIEMTSALGLHVGAHFILGLPFETVEMLLDECSIINSLPLDTVKFHQLQFIKGTQMEIEGREHPERFLSWTLPEYIDFIIDMLERLRPDLAIERVAGEVPPRFVNETRWGLVRNFQILQMLEKRLEEREARQGRLVKVF